MKQREKLILKIDSLSEQGEGVAHFEGRRIFVEGALPEEEVEVVVKEVHQSFAKASVLHFKVLSPLRRVPSCPVFGKCGGCQLMHLEYEAQLLYKQQQVQHALGEREKVLPCRPSPLELSYRNKIQLPIQRELIGLYAKNSHDLVEIETCNVHCPLGERVFSYIREKLKRSSLFSYRYLVIKTAVSTNQVLVIFVTKEECQLQEMAEDIRRHIPEVKGVMQNVNAEEGNVILGKKSFLLSGQDFIEDVLCGLKFKISCFSFFQVNPLQAEQLYLKVLEFSELTKEERVLDAYCGVGTLSLMLAPHAKEVVGIESVEEAIWNARENGRINAVNNVQFYCTLSEEFEVKGFDCVVLNPPRKGCALSFLENILRGFPKRIVYVSCNPKTLARDVRILSERGYVLEKVQPFDLFPQTAHVESVAFLRRPLHNLL